MRWPRRRRRPAVEEAQAHLDRLRGQQAEVNRLTRELREARERNHFAEIVAAAFARKREA